MFRSRPARLAIGIGAAFFSLALLGGTAFAEGGAQHLKAWTTPNGDLPRGHMNAVLTPSGKVGGNWSFTQVFNGEVIHEHAKVTCVRIDGYQAVIGVEFNSSTNPTRPEGSGAFIYMEDHGETGDTWGAGPVLPAGPTACPLPPEFVTTPWPGRIEIR